MTEHKKQEEEKPEIPEGFFMRIGTPLTFRKNILETSKSTLSILKQTYTIRQIRDKKHEKMTALHHQMKEIKVLLQKIDELLPQYSKSDLRRYFPELEPKKRDSSETSKPDKKQDKEKEDKASTARHSVEMEKLSKALNEIQKKLSGL
jgi:hypothetical protein